MQKISKILIFGVCLQLSLLGLFVQAQPESVDDETVPTEIYFEPPKEGEPPDTVGAGTRDSDRLRCSADELQIRAIMPQGNYGLTLQERPHVFFYLPQTSAKQVVLAFQDETEEYHQVAFLPIAQNSNIVSFNLRADQPPLEAGKFYKWKLSLVCGEMPNVDDPELEGWIKRVEPTIAARNLTAKTAIARVDWYAKHGYWYDLLMTLEQARSNNPENNNLNLLWQNLLKNIGIKT